MSDRTEAASGRRWRRVPVVTWLPRYERGWLRGDVVAGAVVAALAVPQALGYASIAGAPVQVGLYAVPVALLAYAIFGSSRQLVVGPVSTVSVLSGSFLASFGVAGTARAASYTAALALGSGLVLLAAGLLGIGWVAEFLSKPIVTGFVVGLTILIILGEIPHLLGVPTPQGQVVERARCLGREPDARRRRSGDGDRVGGLAPRPVRRPAAGPSVAVGARGACRWPDRLGGARAEGAGRGGRRPGPARAADARAAVGRGRRPGRAAWCGCGLGAGGSCRGVERRPTVRRPGWVSDRVRSGAVRVRCGQRRLRAVRWHRGGRELVQDGGLLRGPWSHADGGPGRGRAGPRRYRLYRVGPLGAAAGRPERDRRQRGLEADGLRGAAPLRPGAAQRHRRRRRGCGGGAGIRPAVWPAAGGGRVAAGPGLSVEPGRRRGHGQGAAREGGVGQHPRPRGAGRRSPGSWCSA